MTSKREKLQYAYVFFADLLTMAVSVLLAWLITDGLFGVLIPYTSTDWLQTLCLLFVAFVVTFFFFDQDKNIVTRSENEEISLSLRFNIALGLVYAGCMLLAKATMLDSRYFAVTVPAVNAVLLPFSHAILKRLLIRFQRSWGMETLVGVVTTSDRAERLIPEIQKDWSRRVVGVSLLEATPAAISTRVCGVEVKATFDDFMDWIRREALDEVYVDVPMDSGESFIAKYDPREIAVLLLDVRMSGMSGLEVQEHLLARRADIPIIFITGHGDVPMAVNALKKGAVDFIEKPFDPAALKQLVERMLKEAHDRRRATEQKNLNTALLRKLTTREQQVLERITAGRLNKQIADDLGISIKTVEAHRASIMDKTNSGTVADLMRVVLGAQTETKQDY